jgi:hypothetical protein
MPAYVSFHCLSRTIRNLENDQRETWVLISSCPRDPLPIRCLQIPWDILVLDLGTQIRILVDTLS